MSNPGTRRGGPPPLAPFGLVLHHDGRFSHEGQPIRNRRLREHFGRSVRYVPAESKYVVTLRHFRGEVEVEEAAFFVRDVELEDGTIALSDGSRENLELTSLRASPIDGALLCTVKQDLVAEGLPARFRHSAQAELFDAVEEDEEGRLALRLRGSLTPLPAL